MRITKKFAGSACIGKQSFTPCVNTPENNAKVKEIQAELNEMHSAFIKKLMREQYTGALAPAGAAAAGMGGAYLPPPGSYPGMGYNVMPSYQDMGAMPNLEQIGKAAMSAYSGSPRSTVNRGSISEEQYAQAHSPSMGEPHSGFSGDSNQEYLMQQYKQQVYMQQQHMQQQHHHMLLMMAQQQRKLQNGGAQGDSEVDTNAAANLAQLYDTTQLEGGMSVASVDGPSMVPLDGHQPPAHSSSSSSSSRVIENTAGGVAPGAPTSSSSLAVVDKVYAADGNSSGSDNPSSRTSGSGGTGSGEDAKSNDSGGNSKSHCGTSTTSSSDGHTTMSAKSRSMAHDSGQSNYSGSGEKDQAITGSGAVLKRKRSEKTEMVDRTRSPSSSDDSNTNSGIGGDDSTSRVGISNDQKGILKKDDKPQNEGIPASNLEPHGIAEGGADKVFGRTYALDRHSSMSHQSQDGPGAGSMPNLTVITDNKGAIGLSNGGVDVTSASEGNLLSHKGLQLPFPSSSASHGETIFPWHVPQGYPPYTNGMTHSLRTASGNSNSDMEVVEVDVGLDGTNALTKKNMRKKRNIDDALASGVMGYSNNNGNDLGANAIARFNSQVGGASNPYFAHTQNPQVREVGTSAMSPVNAQIPQRYSFQYPGLPHVFATGYGSSSSIQTLPHAKSISDLADGYDGHFSGTGGPNRARAGSHNPTISYMLSRKAGAMELARAESEQVATNSPMIYGGRDEHAYVFSRAQARIMMEAESIGKIGQQDSADQEASDLLLNFFKKATGSDGKGLQPTTKAIPEVASQLAMRRNMETTVLATGKTSAAGPTGALSSSSSNAITETTLDAKESSSRQQTPFNGESKNRVVAEKGAGVTQSNRKDGSSAVEGETQPSRSLRKSVHNIRSGAPGSVLDGIPASAVDVINGALPVAPRESRAAVGPLGQFSLESAESDARSSKVARGVRRKKGVPSSNNNKPSEGCVVSAALAKSVPQPPMGFVAPALSPTVSPAPVPAAQSAPGVFGHGDSDDVPSSLSSFNHGVKGGTSSNLSADDEGPRIGRSDSSDSLSSNSFEANKALGVRVGDRSFSGSVSSRENGDELNEDSAKSDELSSERSDECSSINNGATVAQRSPINIDTHRGQSAGNL